jgi:hypothetical protein
VRARTDRRSPPITDRAMRSLRLGGFVAAEVGAVSFWT